MIKVNSDKQKLILFLSIIILMTLIHGLVAAEPDETESVEGVISWINTINVTDNNNSPHGAKLPKVTAKDSSTILVAFIRQVSASSSDTDPYIRFSTNNGATWGAITPINENPNTETNILDIVYAA